ncbi:MAG: toprim domain-containing protein, partial [Candidatus Pacebacteria bacterium]|nr:toprim domain-containing protein [Candidatus Paceibacterota bacterium]
KTAQSQQAQTERDRLFKLLDLATKWYEVQLRKTPEIVEYLLKRGLTKETMISFRLGFVPDGWRAIYDYLKSKKFTDREIERAGLAVSKSGSGYYDRFRSRIMFPLFDGRSRVVGFSGRIWGENDKAAKYINSPEGPLFDKSKVLYGYHTAKSAMSKSDYCILVEGQLDVLLSQQSGYENTVAISGTGLTDQHVEMIKRFTDTVYLALDSDKAGIKATRRSVIVSYKHNMRVKVISLREGEDPADTISRSAEAWDVALMEPQDYIDFRMKLSEQDNPDFETKQTLVHNDLFQFISFTKSATTRDHMLQKIAVFLGTPITAVRNDFESYNPEETLDIISEHPIEIKQESIDMKKEFLLMVHYLDDSFSERYESIKTDIEQKYKAIFNTDIFSDVNNISTEERSMSIFVFEEKMADKKFEFFEKKIKESLKTMELDQLKIESGKIQAQIRKEQIMNPKQIPTELMRKSSDIRKKIDSIKNIAE